MDVVRPRAASRRNRTARIATAVAAAAALLGLAAFAASRLKAGPPKASRGAILVDTVQRGEMLREVQAPGTLVPEQVQWITALNAGRVERINVRAGETVSADTVLLELSNPDVELQALEAERQVAAAEAELANLRAGLTNERLAQEATVATLGADLETAQRRAGAEGALADRGFVAPLEQSASATTAAALEQRVKLEKQRLAAQREGLNGRLAAQRTQIDRLKTIAAFRRTQLEAMKVRAGVPGVVQDLALEPGQWVTPGARLATVAKPDRLKARLRVPETLVKDVVPGQAAQIDTHNGVIKGRVARIEPTVQAGAVVVDVTLDGELPKGARPDLSVNGVIELERLPDVLWVTRPAFAQPGSTVTVFKLVSDDSALRQNVQLGRASSTRIEITGGLAAGDRIIVSDTSSWDATDQLRIEP